MDQWLQFLSTVQKPKFIENEQLVARCFTTNLTDAQVSCIKSDLIQRNLTERQIGDTVDSLSYLDGEWPRFNQMVKSYLIWCQKINIANPSTSFEWYAKLLISAQQAYAQQDGYCLNSMLKELISTVWSIFKSSDDKNEWLATTILKLFNTVRAERDVLPVSRKENALYYANMCSRAYFKSKQFTSAKNVFNNMHSLNVKMSQFNNAEQVEYEYWLGRLYIYSMNVELAFTHLTNALQNCLPNSKHQLLITEWLIVPSLLMNKFPTDFVVQMLHPEAQRAIVYIMDSLKSGVLPTDFKTFVRTNDWIRARNLAPILETHLPLLVRRRALKRLAQLANSLKLPFSLISVAFDLQDKPDYVATESVCEALINKGYVVGAVVALNQVLVLKPQNNIPAVLNATESSRQIPQRDQWILE